MTAADVDTVRITPGHDDWPDQLDGLGIAELYVKGTALLNELCTRSVSIVGTRACTAYGQHMAVEIAHDLAAHHGVTVVSGGAYGIDAAAHRGALSAGRETVVVLAGGLDMPYPLAHNYLFDSVVAGGGLLVSEYPPGTPPTRARFLARNRLVAALSQGTVVVEATTRSGSAATARKARTLGRSVMAVPGPVTSGQSALPHQLIKDRTARLVTDAEDVCVAMGFE